MPHMREPLDSVTPSTSKRKGGGEKGGREGEKKKRKKKKQLQAIQNSSQKTHVIFLN